MKIDSCREAARRRRGDGGRMAPSVRNQLIIALAGTLLLIGCVADAASPVISPAIAEAPRPRALLVADSSDAVSPAVVAQAPVIAAPPAVIEQPVVVAPVVVARPVIVLPPDTRMPVTVDYLYHRRILHPPVRHRQGKVNPVPRGPGRERDFGPQSRVVPLAPLPNLLAELKAFRSRAPVRAGAFLAFAKHKRGVAETAKTETLGDPGDGGQEPALPPARGVQDQDGGYRLNFEDADVKDVLHAVLGNVLGLTYTLAPNVTGRITVSSATPQNRSELLSTLETVLQMQGLSLTKVGSTYRIAPTALGGGSIDEDGRSPGFGITVVPLEYSSVNTVSKLLNGFVTDADGVRVDTSRNAIIVRGPGPRREEIVRAIKAMDADWMRQQSVSVIELKRSRPEEVIGELNRIFDNDQGGGGGGLGLGANQPGGGSGGLSLGANQPGGNAGAGAGGGAIQFKAVKRLRSIMVISKNPALVRRAAQWIRRLDHQDTSATDSVFIYRPRYRDARELSRLVKNLFGGGGGDSAGTGSGVAFQQANGQGAGLGQSGGQGGGIGQAPGTGGIGSSTASYAGGLQSGGGFNGGLGGTLGGNAGSGLGGSSAGGGLQGSLAEPIEAGQGGGNGDNKLKLSADSSNNTIVAYTDGETYAKVQSVLRSLDVAPLQVAISVIVAEVQLNDELKYGVQFYLNSKQGSIGLSQVLSSAAGAAATAVAPQAAGFNFLVGGSSSPNLVLNALDQVSKVHILSTPSVVVMENKPATFEVGNQVPIITQQATSTLVAGAPTLNQVTYLDTGIILKIVPRVGQHGDVAMSLDQVISSVVPDPSGAQSLTPTISKRRIASDISVRSGQAVLLAGLINDTRQQNKGQIPFIGEGLGDIFGNKDNVFNRSELVVFIRPVIIRGGQDAQSVTEEFKSHLKAMDLHTPEVTK